MLHEGASLLCTINIQFPCPSSLKPVFISFPTLASDRLSFGSLSIKFSLKWRIAAAAGKGVKQLNATNKTRGLDKRIAEKLDCALQNYYGRHWVAGTGENYKIVDGQPAVVEGGDEKWTKEYKLVVQLQLNCHVPHTLSCSSRPRSMMMVMKKIIHSVDSDRKRSR